MQKKGELESAIKSALEFHLRFHKLVHLTMHKKAQNNSAKRDLKGMHLIGLEGCTWRLALACEDVFSISVNGSLNDALKGAHERTFEDAPKNALDDLPKDAKKDVLEVALGLAINGALIKVKIRTKWFIKQWTWWCTRRCFWWWTLGRTR